MVSSTTSGQTARQAIGLHYFNKSREKNFFSIVELHDYERSEKRGASSSVVGEI